MEAAARDGTGSRGRLEARALVLSRAGRRVLDGASIAIGPGEIATIEGASGCGKTTLLRALATLVATEGGALWLDGLDARAIAPTVFRTRVAYVPQQPPMLEGSVADNVATGPRLRGVAIDATAVAALLARVGLEAAFAARVARELSGGERQRVALARALANAPGVLLLDEPTAALDPQASERVIALVRQLASEGLAVVVVTHAAEHARALGGAHYRCADGVLTRCDEGG